MPIGLSPLLILTLCGSERVLVVSTEPLDDLSCWTTPGVGRPGDGLLPVPLTRCIQMHPPSPLWGFADSSAGVRICWIIFLTGASNSHDDSFRGGGGGGLASPGRPAHHPTSERFSSGKK